MSSLNQAIAALPVLLYLTAPVQASHQNHPKTFIAQIQQRSSAESSADAYDRAMRIGYTASQHRDYQTALLNFRRALQQRPGDPYATKAIQNVQRYLLAQQSSAPAPWSKPAIPPSEVPAVLLQQWRQADNRSSCAALAPTSLGQGAGATPRAADFSGGWAVAYDKPGLPGRGVGGSRCTDCGKGAFGIAGTGLEQAGTEDQGWLYQQVWSDGSRTGYGLQGSRFGQAALDGPYLAYLIIPNQKCLYNVWSYVGREHLEYLLEHLRFVKAAP